MKILHFRSAQAQVVDALYKQLEETLEAVNIAEDCGLDVEAGNNGAWPAVSDMLLGLFAIHNRCHQKYPLIDDQS